MSRAARLATEARSLFKQADIENRPLTGEERAHAQALIDEAEEVGRHEKRLDALGHQLGAAAGLEPVNGQGQSVSAGGPGDVFVQAESVKALLGESSSRPQQWSSGMIEVSGPPRRKSMMQRKGTLLEGDGSPGSGTGGGLIPIPQVAPGVVETLFQPLTIEDLLSADVATGNTVRYAIEGTATSGAAGVAEGGTKPESTIALSTVDENVRKIATTLIVSDELLFDAPGIQSFLNDRLSTFVRTETERQILRGTAAPEVVGLFNRSIPIYAGGTAQGDAAAQLFKAINGVRGSALVEPEFVLMHPDDYQRIRLLQDTSKQYYGGGPFAIGPYGGPAGPIGPSGQLTGAVDNVWGKPVRISTVVGSGTALIGSSQAACIWNRGGLSVEATNSHGNLFTQDLMALRAERRLGLTLYRKAAFCECRFGY